jgi:hypothetical protein
MRAVGLPSSPIVASVIACASLGSVFQASSSHVLNSAKGCSCLISLTRTLSRNGIANHSLIEGFCHRSDLPRVGGRAAMHRLREPRFR